MVNNLNYRQWLNERVGPTLGYVSLERKQLAENSTVYVQVLDNQMLLTGVRLNSPSHICNHVNATKLHHLKWCMGKLWDFWYFVSIDIFDKSWKNQLDTIFSG